jgi:hypothetical protein
LHSNSFNSIYLEGYDDAEKEKGQVHEEELEEVYIVLKRKRREN